MDFNPNYPEVLGLEWWPTQRQTTRVWTGAAARMVRMPSTATESVDSVLLSATVDPNLRADTYTVLDVYEEGGELAVPAFKAVELIPNSDVLRGNWTTQNGGIANLWARIDDSATKWPNPGPAVDEFIQNKTSHDNYTCTVDASRFDTGGDLENSRIGFVEVRAIVSANTGVRKIRTTIEIDGTNYFPAGDGLRDAHYFGASYIHWYGELNPKTLKPWTPADIADFDEGGGSTLRVRSGPATASQFVRVHALRLFVWCVPTEERKAVGVWQRPDDLTDSQIVAQTDSLVTMPAGTAGWAKETAKNYVYYWRQSVSPSLYGPVNADDVRWNGAYQHLHDSAQPGGQTFPLTSTHRPDDPPADAIASSHSPYDQFGRPTATADMLDRPPAYGIVPIVGGVASVDSQPYRHDLDTLVLVRHATAGGQSAGQRVTMPSTQTYLGVRFPVIPPSYEAGSLDVTIRDAATGTQIGTSAYTITAAQARALPAGPGGVRYVSGLFTSAVAMTNATQYEIRFTSTSLKQDWVLFAPSAEMEPSMSFGGETDCLRLGSTSYADQDLCVTLVKQPDAPTAVTLASEVVAVANPDGSTRDVEHVEISWTTPAITLGTGFARFELERQVVGESTWQRVANFATESTTSYVDHLVPRGIEVAYRIRGIAKDGRFSAWAESSGTFTPSEGDYSIVLTSNHVPELEVAFDQDLEARFEFRSDENSEVIQLHGADYQVVFEETENRGVGFSAGIEVSFSNAPPAGGGGEHVFDALRSLVRSQDTPHITFLDWQGVKKLGHVVISGATQTAPGHIYKATIEVIPTHDEEIPVEVS